MTRSMLAFLMAGLVFGGCSDPELEKRLADMEERVKALEARPAGGAAARAASPEDEQAAANLLKEAQTAYEGLDMETTKAKLDELASKYGTSRANRAAQRLKAEVDVVGRDEANLEVEKWFKGTEADVTGGEATLYVFWEVWCPHCKREVPKLSATYEKFKGQGLTMVGLTKQTRGVTDDAVKEFIDTQNVSYPIAKEDGDSLSQHYGVRGIPAAAMVKDGKVIWRGHPARLSDDMISKFLGS